MQPQVTTQARTATELLDAYRPGDHVLLASSRGVLLAEGAAARPASFDGIGAALAAVGGDRPIAVGALPFSATAAPRIVVPAAVHRAPAFASGAAAGDMLPLPGPWRIRPVPEPAEHVRAVERALKLLAEGDTGPGADPGGALRKVVLARTVRLSGDAPVDITRVLRNLARRDPHGYTYAVDLPPRGTGPRTLIGASPELLVAKHGPSVRSTPLAGSAPRSADATEDQRRAVALLGSAKDRHEHAVVVDAVAETLRPFCRSIEVPTAPQLHRTAAMWHLSTAVTGELRDPDTPSHELARALHPTPAVCGTPRDRARSVIAEVEPFDRGFYTGAVGYTDARGDGEWAVAIRCADVAGTELEVFAGGGIVAESDPDAELAETSAKLRTLLLAVGVNEAP